MLPRLKNFLKNNLIEKLVVFKYRLLGVNMPYSAKVSLGAKIDTTHPTGVYIGEHVLIARGACILSHDFVNQKKLKTMVGNNVFIGAYSIILPGVSVPSNCVVGAGAVVTKSFPSNSVIAGNPAKIIVKNKKIGSYGRMD